MKTTNKSLLFAILALFVATTAFARKERNLHFGLGINHCYSFKGYNNDKYSLYVDGAYKFLDTPYTLNLRVSDELFTHYEESRIRIKPGSDEMIDATVLSQWGAITITPTFNYEVYKMDKLRFNIGAGPQLAMSNIQEANGKKWHFYTGITPRLDLLLFNHLDISSDFHFFLKDSGLNRAVISVGYYF